MLQYVNNVHCITDENKTTFIFHFLQDEPRYQNENEEITTVTNDIASIVMDKRGFLTLAKIVLDQLQDTGLLDELDEGPEESN